MGAVSESGGWVLRSQHRQPVLQEFGRYRMLGRLAVGGMAEIYLAQTKDEERFAVIKRMMPNLVEDEHLVEMFYDEARLGMRLRHPNLCHFYDVGELEGHLCMAMEWIHGVTLEALLERASSVGGIPHSTALSIIADVADALDSVHRARDEVGRPLNIVHRDVTPKNLMIGYSGGVKLLDFGLAKSATNLAITSPGVTKGKFAYIAPELWEGAPVDPRADVFSLGVCLFEAIAGRPLYHYARPRDTHDAIVHQPVPSLRAREPGIPIALEKLVMRCLAKRPEDRFESAGAMEIAIRKLLLQLGEPGKVEPAQGLLTSLFSQEIAAGPQLEPTRFGDRASSVPPAPAPSPQTHLPKMLPPASPARSRAKRQRAKTSPRYPRGGRTLSKLAGASAVGALVLLGTLAITLLDDRAPDVEPMTAAARIGVPLEKQSAPVVDPPAEAPIPEPGSAAYAEPEPVLDPEPIAVRRPAPEQIAVYGTLSINSSPWSEVFIDGRSLGHTPLGDVSVAVGVHELRLVDGRGREIDRRVRVSPEDCARVYERFGDEAAPELASN